MSLKTTGRGIANWGAWKFELWALVGSVLSFAIMVIVLAIFDGRPIFEWKSVTLNAIISVLSVAMKAGLTFAVAELIGQWKWILSSLGERLLIDFERIDMATRGPWGSLRVLSRMRGLQM
jgi:predicted Ser/Thr protein kinase